ncbi:threonine ammonia-lyase [Denitromonas ohlonensis]|uniref:L-serine dehydratase n=2 Tax=Denitromonas TaxID=139331 RepID=A0A557RTP4_9RHOO|nr:threonine ammonia-lyase [Denitromonas ohlonensis]TVO68515.1 threonine ammonia-lyase [Denitromonas ohlonensis]TVO74793.1 threonine ammonia-lyase [Denitromonas ohlonensis]
MPSPLPLDLSALIAARQRIEDAIIRTVQWHNDPLSEAVGVPLQLKLENLQRTGSFKLRGASHKIDRLLASGDRPSGVIAASAGNHAQGVARAAALAGLKAVVVMPGNAPLTKIQACRALGAEVVLEGDTLEQAADEARRRATAEHLAFLHPYDDWDVIAGQASCGLEMLEDAPDMTVAVVPLGGGGLIAGIALALKLQRPDIRVIGVQTETVAPYRNFLVDGTLETVPPGAHTIADGIKVKRPGERNRQVIAALVDEIVTVDDNAIAEAIVTLVERTRTIGEGAGVVGLAALMQGKIRLAPSDRVVCVISGGNVDMTLVGRSIDYGLASSGRLMSVAVTTSDAPGQLLTMIQRVAALGINIRHVEHRRGELHVPVGMTEVILQMETRDFEHQCELLADFTHQGLSARNLLQLPGSACDMLRASSP